MSFKFDIDNQLLKKDMDVNEHERLLPTKLSILYSMYYK
jgi:hypothetical protein